MRLPVFVVQASCVAGLTGVVGYPQIQTSAQTPTVWRVNGPLTPLPDLVAEDARLNYGPSMAITPESERRNAQAAAAVAAQRVAANQARALRNSDDGSFAGNDRQQVAAMIAGIARTATNRAVPFARMMLRNLTTGRVEAEVRADQNGQFSFLNVGSSQYVIEMTGNDGSIIAASELVSVSRSDVSQATVRLGSNATVRAIFGSVSDPVAVAATVAVAPVPTVNPASPTTTTTTATTQGTAASSAIVGGTAAETVTRAAEAGVLQTTPPETCVSSC